MSIELNQSILRSISTDNPSINNAAKTVDAYTDMCKEGRINTQELQELLLDIQRQINIEQNMSDLENLEKLNTAINGLITIAKMAA